MPCLLVKDRAKVPPDLMLRRYPLALVLATALATCSVENREKPAGMVLIRGGEMLMGIGPQQIESLLARYNVSRSELFEVASPAFLVNVASFFLDRTEVTNADFVAFVEANSDWNIDNITGELHNGDYLAHWIQGQVPPALVNHPVTNVSWPAAMAYCSWKGGRLPAEAEWEFAARGGGVRDYPWGNEEPAQTRANYSGSGFGEPAAVGSYAASPEGLHDLAGNVWEYCADPWRDSYSSGEPTAPGQVRVWLNTGEFLGVQGRRVIRGASYGGAAFQLRGDYRDSHPATGAVAHVGFRCARTIE